MKLFKRFTSYLLTIGIFLYITPSALAANSQQSVLTSVGSQFTDTVSLTASQQDIVLTVPYSFSGTTVDLSNNLNAGFDETKYKAVVLNPGAIVTIDGDPVSLAVTYNLIGDAEGAERIQTDYTIRVVRAAVKLPTFSGTIQKPGVYPETLFTAEDFIGKYTQNDGGALGAVSITGSYSDVGKLQISGNDYSFGTLIGVSDLYKLTFVASASGTVSFNVSAYAGADTAHPLGSVVLTVIVPSASVPIVQSAITMAVNKGASATFSASTFESHCKLSGGLLKSVEITPTGASVGTWAVAGTAFTGPTVVDLAKISTLSFSGTTAGSASFKWRVSNEAGYSDYGMGTITVSSLSLVLSSYTASSAVLKGNTWTISPLNFSYSPSTSAITYVKISSIPSGADGSLCLATALPKNDTYGYPAIAANASLATGAVIPYSYLGSLRLVTKSTSTAGSVSFTWTATADTAVSTAVWAPAASYTVEFVSSGTLTYETDLNIPIRFNAADFSSQFLSHSGSTLSYVTFTPPDKAFGALYYNYNLSTKAGTQIGATKYYTGTSPRLSDVTFVPATDYTGTVNIEYKAYTSDGVYLAGTLKVTVSNSAGGTVGYVTDKNAPLQLDARDFSNAFLNATGKTLSYVKFTLPSSTYGGLYYDYTSASNFESTVSSSKKYYVYSSPYLSYVTFVPKDDYTGSVTINFTGYTSNGSTYNGKIRIFVVDSPAGIVIYTAKVNGIIKLSAEDFTDEFISVTGSVLSSITFGALPKDSGALVAGYSPDTGKGTSISSAKYYSGASPDISDLTFIPNAGYIGTAVVPYTVLSTSGVSYEGKLKFIIGDASAGTVTYSTDLNAAVKFDAGDFSSKFSSNTGGGSLSGVTFALPSASYGKLYYEYDASRSHNTEVSSETKYFANSSPDISDVSFVPSPGYSGSFTISYVGYAQDGSSYVGKIKITVGNNTVGTVNYSTNSLTPVKFSATDFSTAFSSELGVSLSYVMFTPPSSSFGTLYYGYTSPTSYSSVVSSDAKYYANTTKFLSNVTFVPKAGFTGVVTINYLAYDSNGNPYAGMVGITVYDSGTIPYQTDVNTPVKLNADDFGDVLQNGGFSLLYVRFTLPSSAYGALYYDYTSPSNVGSAVSPNTGYYKSSYPSLSRVTFVPAKNYTGQVTVAYTAYDSGGRTCAGTVEVTVGRASAGTVSYQTDRNKPVSLNSDDFNTAFLSKTGASLNCVTFTLPSSSSGRLYYGNSSSTQVTVSTKYYRTSSPLLSSVVFVPSDGYVGAVTVPYTAYNADGASYKGELIINVVSNQPFTDIGAGYAWASDAVSYLYSHDIVNGSGDGLFRPKDNISRGDFMLMIYRAFRLKSAASDNFPDVSKQSYYYDAIAAAKALGITNGVGGKFSPAAAITRQDAMVIIQRTLEVIGKTLQKGSANDLQKFSDAGNISDYAVEAMSALTKAGFINGSNGGLHPKDSISRAEMATILYRILTTDQ